MHAAKRLERIFVAFTGSVTRGSGGCRRRASYNSFFFPLLSYPPYNSKILINLFSFFFSLLQLRDH